MRKFAVTLMASLLSCSAAFAFWPEATDSSLEIGVGYRQDKLEWKTRGRLDTSYSDYSDSNNGNKNSIVGLPTRVSSHLKWRDLDIWQIEARGKYITCDNIYLRANADYGWITHGKNTDTDNKTFQGVCDNDVYDYSDFEFARSHSKVKGHVYDIRLAIGYQFKLCDDSFSIVPLVGYSWHGQHLQDRHLRQDAIYGNGHTFDGAHALVGDFDASDYSYSDVYYSSGSYSDGSYSYGRDHSKYHTRWNGPYIGFDFDWRFGCACEWDVFGGYEFHWAQYHARADWKLRHELLDGFHHRAKDAYGHIFDVGVKWDFCECWTLAVKGEFQWWWADKGRDRVLVAEAKVGNVKGDCNLTIPLRDIKWQSAAVSIDLGMVF